MILAQPVVKHAYYADTTHRIIPIRNDHYLSVVEFETGTTDGCYQIALQKDAEVLKRSYLNCDGNGFIKLQTLEEVAQALELILEDPTI